jgi:hypothetical protein
VEKIIAIMIINRREAGAKKKESHVKYFVLEILCF